jgi:integrase
MTEVGKAPRRTKSFSLDLLKDRLGKTRIADLTRERLIAFGKARTREGAGPVTLAADFAYMRTIVAHAAAVHGIAASLEPITLARIALKRLGLIGPGRERDRDRRPTAEEIEALLHHLDTLPRCLIPTGRIVRFAIATGLRQEEICSIKWSDVDERHRLVTVRDRKDPRKKDGNHQKVPLLDATGFDAWALIQEQKEVTGGRGRIFPYNSRSVGTAFRRACRLLLIEDLHFHDLRHECASRLFEAGFTIEQVALVTGHRDWKMLKRYTNLRPESLHRLTALNRGAPARARAGEALRA